MRQKTMSLLVQALITEPLGIVLMELQEFS